MKEALSADLASLLRTGDHPECECVCCRASRELERLERERSEWAGIAATRNRNIALIAEERDAAVKALAELRADAVETVQHWGGYVSDYFREKHNLPGDIERLRGSNPYRPATTADAETVTESTAVVSASVSTREA